jgi:predicted DNA-binding protein
MSNAIKLPQIRVTKDQKKWLEYECQRTGENQTTVIRKLIQEKIDYKENKS